MPESTTANPSEMALAELSQRIANDASLEDAVKQAVLEDLACDNPAALTRLQAVLSVETEVREADSAQST